MPRRSRFGIRWGHPTKGPTLEETQKRLKQIRERENKPEPSWFFDQSFDHLSAALEAKIDPDRWEEMTHDGRGIVVAIYRARKKMDAWESHFFRPQGK